MKAAMMNSFSRNHLMYMARYYIEDGYLVKCARFSNLEKNMDLGNSILVKFKNKEQLSYSEIQFLTSLDRVVVKDKTTEKISLYNFYFSDIVH